MITQKSNTASVSISLTGDASALSSRNQFLMMEKIMEGTAATFLKKMLTPVDPNFVDIRSPVGAGTGQSLDLFGKNIDHLLEAGIADRLEEAPGGADRGGDEPAGTGALPGNLDGAARHPGVQQRQHPPAGIGHPDSGVG